MFIMARCQRPSWQAVGLLRALLIYTMLFTAPAFPSFPISPILIMLGYSVIRKASKREFGIIPIVKNNGLMFRKVVYHHQI